MDFSIYVVGDGYTFYSVLNAIAMVFNSNSFWNSVFALAGLCTLIGVLFQMVQVSGGASATSGAFGMTAPLYFAAIVALIGIRSNAVIQDIYSGQVYKVSNIPIIVTVPASIFTTASYNTFQWIDAAYSLPNATSSLSVGAVGFLNPLKILLALRTGLEGGADPNARKTLDEYVAYCAEPGPTTFDANTLATQTQVSILRYLQTNAFKGGMVNIYNTANPSGLPGSCAAAASYLVNYFETQIGSPSSSAYLAAILNLRMREKNPANLSSTGAWTGTAGVQSIMQIGGTAAQDAKTFFVNAITLNTINLALTCRHQRVMDAEYANCLAETAKADSQEGWKSAETFAASFFMGTALLTQTSLQLMFFAVSPIILMYMLFAGASGFQTYWQYIIFGIWTSSFLVFMAVIQGLILLGLQARAVSFIGQGLSLSNASDMYNSLSFWLAAGSSLMASVPLLSYGLLKGGGNALVAISGRMNGDKHVNPNKVQPDLLKNGSLVGTAPGMNVDLGSGVGKSSMAPPIQVSTSNKVSQVDSQALQSSISQSWGKNWQGTKTEQDSAGTKFTATTDGVEYAKEDGTKGSLSKQEAAGISAAGGLKVMGNGVGVNVKTGRQYSQDQVKAFNMAQRIGWNTGAEAGHSTSLIGSLTESEQQSIAKQLTTATQKARTQEVTISQTYDINALKGIRDANPQAYDTKINNQAMDMARGPNGLAFDKAMQKATQDLNGYQMDWASKEALIKTVALANTQTNGVDISGLTRPDVSGVNQSRPNINPGTSLSTGAQMAARGKVEAGAADLRRQNTSERANLEPASGAMAVAVTGDALLNTAGAFANVVNLPGGAEKVKAGENIGRAVVSPADMNYGPDGSPIGASPTNSGRASGNNLTPPVQEAIDSAIRKSAERTGSSQPKLAQDPQMNPPADSSDRPVEKK